MRHVIIMSMSSSIGLVAIFLVDFMDMYFLSLLGETELAAAIGYSGSVLFFTTAICIGFSIAMGALVSRSIGAGSLSRARRYLVNTYISILGVTSVLAVVIWILIPDLIELLGAKGRAAELSIAYLEIMIPSMPILGVGIASGSALRAVGDARRSMTSTLIAGAVNAVLDPIFIFSCGMGVEGAAVASVIARFTMLVFSFIPIVYHHHLLTACHWRCFKEDVGPVFNIALPAILTNVATPVANAYITANMAKFGDSVVAGMSIIGRVIPVAFGVVYAVSGAVGPIIGQNFGAGEIKRVKSTLSNGYIFIFGYVGIVSLVLFFIPDIIGRFFHADPEASHIITVFCTYVAITFAFSGATFVGNAAFNNLGYPRLSALVNWGKATIGIMPFVYYGGLWFQGTGVLLGEGLGNVLFGFISIVWSYLLLKQLKD